MENIIFKRYEKLAQKVIKNLEKRHFTAFYCDSKESAFNKLLELISKEETVSWGGSVTIDELKIKDYLENNNYKTINRDKAQTREERESVLRKSITADIFLMSTNAITEDGELVNIDGHGNRIAALSCGAKKVIVVAGVNKIVKTLDDAVSRARNIAAPINAQRCSNFFPMQTPCIETGSCMDCKSPTSICAQILTTRLSHPQGRIIVILVNDTIGY